MLSLNVKDLPITDSQVYSRLALGRYLQEQYVQLVQNLKALDIKVTEYRECEIADIVYQTAKRTAMVFDKSGNGHEFDKVVVATGHKWKDNDRPDDGYYASPWPIHKILPDEGTQLNYTVGTLGASLSAFDVITSLAHRHGTFIKDSTGLRFERNGSSPEFKVVMHSAEGWLPHLQYEQEEPMRVTAVILLTRICGKRSFSKMSSFDFAMTVAVDSIIATTVLSSSVKLIDGIIGLVAVYILQIVVAIARRNKIVKKIVDNSPLLLMDGEKILIKNLRKARVSESDLRSKLREANVTQLSQIKAVVFETTGDISVLHKDNDESLNLWLMNDVMRE